MQTQVPTPTECAEIIEVLNGLLDRNVFTQDDKKSIGEVIMALTNVLGVQVGAAKATGSTRGKKS